MKAQSIAQQSRLWKQALAATSLENYSLRLFITGSTPKSMRAVTNIKRICESHLKGRYTLEVVDIYQQPALAKGGQIIAAPTLVKSLPLPTRKLVGDMTDKDRILQGLNLRPN
ncbi:MAG: thiol-disulfide isomerase [Verrucomicrobiales bacterium]|jgi:circadian clock protein KaiB|nr:thiol-disulfide isomerase [Verrucomicrobiales bacterium]